MADVSVLGHLEPLFGASLAINLAYLNLNQFRYRNSMAASAKDKLEDAPTSVYSTSWYKEIKSLADQTGASKVKLTLPKSWWGLIYKPLFHWRWDKYISIILTVLSAAFLFLGVAHSIGLFPETIPAFTKEEIGNELAYATLGLCWPMAMVLIAKYCTHNCRKFVQYQLSGITKHELEAGADDIVAATAEMEAKKAK